MVVFGFYSTKTNLGLSSDIILFVKNSIDFLFCSKLKAHAFNSQGEKGYGSFGMGYNNS